MVREGQTADPSLLIAGSSGLRAAERMNFSSCIPRCLFYITGLICFYFFWVFFFFPFKKKTKTPYQVGPVKLKNPPTFLVSSFLGIRSP